MTPFELFRCAANFCGDLPWVHITRFTAILVWSVVFYQSYSGLKALLFASRSTITTQHRNDAWVTGVAMMVLSFNLRWYVNVDSESLFTGLYVFCTMVAIARIVTYKSDQLVSEGSVDGLG